MSKVSRLVCVVDDDKPVRTALNRLLQRHGYESLGFSNGRDCLDGHEVDQADVVIIDVTMPGMDGFELHTLLRASGRRIPTIFISAFADSQYAARAESVGAVTILGKPCEEGDLLHAIESAINT
jgi:FixJ family two-component response regulator